ncbi:MAG TPA: HlyD family efflux transporter periplasmic adaptor subunit [Candidatus Limnocylindrales bacterium]|nr:HlyD family efflux transporter periplasmic adaptor subunit [Candidatus Limnocylindrales bacterium]
MSSSQKSPESGANHSAADQAGSQSSTQALDQGQMLSPEPPPQIIRCIGWLVIVIFILLFLASVLVHIPETVRCSFVLVPENGADPIQSPLLALVQAVKVTEGQEVPAGTELFVLRSDEIRGWQTQLRTSEEELRNLQNRTGKMEEYYNAQIAIKKQEIQSAERDIIFREKHLATARDVLDRNEKLADQKLVSEIEMLEFRLAAAESEKDLNVAQRRVEQLSLQQQELDNERARQRADEQSELEKLKLRIDALKRQSENCAGDMMSIRAPYRAAVISLAHRNAGGVVQHGAELCQLARAEGEPRARLLLDETGVPKLIPGQRVRLFFEAFPYQRYGTITGKLDWISPAAVTSPEGQRFTGRASLDQTVFRTRGQERPLRVGMKGEARLVVGTRTLVEYAFEPLRQLRELSRNN